MTHKAEAVHLLCSYILLSQSPNCYLVNQVSEKTSCEPLKRKGKFEKACTTGDLGRSKEGGKRKAKKQGNESLRKIHMNLIGNGES
jgi:hypothetical protein